MSGSAFSLTDHACRHCGGRVLQAGDQFRCGTCSAVGMGSTKAICGCGAFPNVKGGGYRCEANPNRNPANPAEIVIAWAPSAPRARRPEALRMAA